LITNRIMNLSGTWEIGFEPLSVGQWLFYRKHHTKHLYA
jgi:hypothetical protein